MSENRQHSACDECRRRKIKCNGANPCQNCADEPCVYSPQKTMGRPRKRARAADEMETGTDQALTLVDTQDSGPVVASNMPSSDDSLMPSRDIATHGASTSLDQYLTHEITDTMATGQQEGNHSSHYSSSHGTCDHRGSFVPAEYCNVSSSSISPNGHEYDTPISSTAFNIAMPPIDTASPSEEKCTCLSSMYLAAANLEATAHSGFPIALTPLRAALLTSRGMLLCQSIASGFQTLLRDIDKETLRAQQAGETKIFDSGDSSAINLHLHTGLPDCPGNLALELEPAEWNAIVKRAVKKHAFKQRNGTLCLDALVDAVEQRQRAMHSGIQATDEWDEIRAAGENVPQSHWVCLRLVQNVRMIMDTFR